MGPNGDTPVSRIGIRMTDSIRLATASRDAYQALRRVERQQVLIERLYAARGAVVPMNRLATELGVSTRTVQRDVERLLDSGVPLETRAGRGGGVRMPVSRRLEPVSFDLAELAALMSSLSVLGPSVTPSAGSAMRKLVEAIRVDE
jgi:predicted DNA-binding transcriptional regulator YafY